MLSSKPHDMQNAFQKLANEAEQTFASEVRLDDNTPLYRACQQVYQQLEQLRIGPAVLTLLVVSAFPEQSREKLWRAVSRLVRQSPPASPTPKKSSG